jgi:hypothetical protein
MVTGCNPDRRLQSDGRFVLLWLKDACIPDDLAFLRANPSEVDGVGLSSAYGFRGRDIGFLRDEPIRALSVVNSVDLSEVRGMTQLRSLGCGPDSQPLDLVGLHALEVLSVGWHRRLQLPAVMSALDTLTVWGWTPHDLVPLAPATALRTLSLIQGPVRSLRGMPSGVTSLELVHLRQLFRLEGVPPGLEQLDVDGCPVTDVDVLGGCASLRVLVLADCGRIPSLRFVGALPKLERVALAGSTVVADGDLSPLLAVPQVTFRDRSSYNLTLDAWRKARRP